MTDTELIRRSSGTFKPAFNMINDDSDTPSFLREKYHMYFNDLIERLKVDMAILDYNYIRLNKYMRKLFFVQIRLFNVPPQEIQCIDEKEYPLLLEFFLQFDGMLLTIMMISSCLFLQYI